MPPPTPDGPVGPYAFVFWNDDLDDAAVLGQLREIAGAGFVGVTLSARVGLGRRVGYLTAEFLRLVRVAVDECARLGLAVMLYDEASYPSGSANGGVVARDPAFAARCLVPVTRDVAVTDSGPDGGDEAAYWRPALGRDLDARLLGVVARPAGDDTGSRVAVLLPVHAPGLVRLALPTGAWRVTAVFDATSGGTIRGAHAEQDDGSALAPPAADLLNPDAIATFLELTHDAYAAALGEHLGTTVVAMFTDEPFLLGRGHRPLARPYTPGLEAEVAARLDVPEPEVLRRLPELWDSGDGTRPGGTDPDATGFVRAYDDAVRARLHRVYYDAQAAWCAAHGIALTGHPAEPDDLATAGRLHWPGQDTVWRWVLPGDTVGTSGLDGPESTAPKVAASAARRRGAPAVTEVLGAYGWRLSLDEARWLLDWYLSRGVTTPVLHAFFASVRGGRAFESEPDLGRWNSWWPHLAPLVGYVRRVAELLDATPPVWPVGVLSRPDAAPSGPVVRALLEAQVDFGYVDRDDAAAAAGTDLVLVDPDDGVPDVAALKDDLRSRALPVVDAEPAAPGLRAVVLAGGAGYVVFHEGEERVRTALQLPAVPDDACWWDPFADTRHPVERDADGRVLLDLERRRTLALVRAAGRPVVPAAPALGRRLEVAGWRGTVDRVVGDADAIADDPSAVAPPELRLGDWSREPALRRLAGSVRYAAEVDVPDGAGATRLDLGVVGEAATVRVDGVVVGHALTAPYVLDLPAGTLRPGRRTLEVLVSNSAANYYEGDRRPSGLIGPVALSW
ncbi:hypothetical protein [Krasilnikoviella flava]|uniref:Glycosyl hydrolases family 2, sugar binding domain n=1 Tax=Krasilnikoviella flava TaxID=526729 RepID=A0A1T5J283_9MICO|nr:hypothetical protein [Krasilnikoviella flava]SKC45431.1 hypothetical protein SAMN04324258_0951 [Krasilnikoviella flava]